MKSHVVKGPFPLYELCRIAAIVSESPTGVWYSNQTGGTS